MEEDIDILEEIVNTYYECARNKETKEPRSVDILFNIWDTQALENLIKGYRELQTKYNEFKEDYNEMYEDCAELQGIYHQHVMRITTLENLVDNSIPKSKIKETIEELEEIKTNYAIGKPNYQSELAYAIGVLQELMEDK